ncbi:Glutathione S-transferase-like protein FUS3 [Penicillium oxalicum]|uniref:Glutathione S-transferase-like protein FUS3 n=1 Tax=Penicillium oxalicum TaxID=69781 RepID=UPI0020B6DE23|nr:Glutathione S-transferase-like protein FUS3 [Penicillium oxalicum]KAI2790655.1 Glutathione S-transferase-like protein FUS3 [Penicillium oxalicum]
MAPFGTIWSYSPSPRVMKIQAAGNINGLEVAVTPDFVMGQTNTTDEFRAKFPFGKVPAFEGADGTLLTESDAIAQYVAESGPEAASLMGATPAERAAIRQWICFAQGEVIEPVTQLGLWRLKFVPYNEATEKQALQRIERSLAYLESHLKGRTWLVGNDKVSMADITVGSSLVWGFSLSIDAEMRQKYPVTIAWFERLIQVDGVKQAFGEQTYVEKRQEYEG